MDLKISTFEDYILIHHPLDLCLYSDSGQQTVEKIIDIAGTFQPSKTSTITVTRPKAVIFYQKGPAVDWVDSWIKELEDFGVQKRLYEHILAVRWMLYLIRHSEVPWIYWSDDDTLGSHWELALACHLRYFVNFKSKIGFPEITTGAFVPGGILEALSKNGSKIKDKWQAQPTMSADQGFQEGLIHYCAEGFPLRSGDDYAHMVSIIKKRMESTRPPLSPKIPATGFSGFKSSINLDFFSRKTPSPKLQRITAVDLETYYRENSSRASDFLDQKAPKPPYAAWDYCWQVIKDRANSPRPLHDAAAIARIAALAFYQKPYKTWLRDQWAIDHTTRQVFGTKRLWSLPPLVIDITLGPPPAESLAQLAEDRILLITSSLSSQDFKHGLELLYSRLDRWMGHALAAQLWTEKISYTQGPYLPKHRYCLKWNALESMTLQRHDEKPLNFQLIGPDRSGLQQSSLQWLGQPLDAEVLGILSQICDQFLHIHSGDGPIPWDRIIRSLLLEELILASKDNGGDLSKFCDQLRRFGWGFAADEESWSHYLKEAEDLSVYKTELPSLDALIHHNNQFLWEVGSWKQARTMAKRESQEADQNAVALSQDLAFFVGSIAEWVTKALPNTSPSVIDQLTLIGVGFPKIYGSPLKYLNSLGPRRQQVIKDRLYQRGRRYQSGQKT